MREIITLQVGNNSNYVATHFWNTQQISTACDHEILYANEFPRTVLLDLKGSFGTLGEQEVAESNWDGQTDSVVQPAAKKNEFQEDIDNLLHSYSNSLEKSVQTWSDYNQSYYHPYSLMEVASHTHKDETNLLATFTMGQHVYKALEADLMEERIRKIMEESDNPQGFQIYCDVDSGFSGIGSEIVQALSEDYRKKSFFVFGIHAPVHESESIVYVSNQDHVRVKQVNSALFLASMLESSPVYVPLYAPLKFNQWPAGLFPRFNNTYTWSAYLASAIESITIPFRLLDRNKRIDMHDVQRILNPSLSSALSSLDIGVCPPDLATDEWICNLSLQQKMPLSNSNEQSFAVFRSYDQGSIPDDVLKKKLCSLLTSVNIHQGFPIGPSFPQFFSDGEQELKTVPLFTRLQSGNIAEPLMEQAQRALGFPIRDKWLAGEFALGDYGLDDTSWKDKQEEFQCHQECYQSE